MKEKCPVRKTLVNSLLTKGLARIYWTFGSSVETIADISCKYTINQIYLELKKLTDLFLFNMVKHKFPLILLYKLASGLEGKEKREV